MDSMSREEYVAKVRGIHELPSLTPAQRELAERFAYGVFVLRPLALTTFTMEFQRDPRASGITRIHAVTREDWLGAPDLKAFASWVAERDRLDFLTASMDEEPQALEHLRA